MKKIMSSLLCFLLLSLTLLPFAFAAGTDSDNQTPSVKSVEDFKDLKDLPQELKTKFDELIRGGVFSGVSEDTFGLDSKMDRAQFAKVAAIIFSLPMDKTLTNSSFTDISSDHWSLIYVEALKKAGLTNGYDAEGKMYNPSGVVSRQELATFLIRGLGLDEAAKKATPVADSTVDDWAKGYVSLALEKKIMTKQDDGAFGGKESATRKMLALASYEAKKLFAESKTTPTPEPTNPATPAPANPTPPATQPDKPATPAPQAGQVSAKGKKAVITGDAVAPGSPETRGDEKSMVSRLQSLGFEVTYMLSTKLSIESVQGYDLVVIGESTNSKYVKAKLKTLTIPIIYVKSISFGDADFSSVSEKTTIQKQSMITIANPNHPIAAGLKGDVQIYLDPANVSYGIPSADGVIIASPKDDPAKGVIIAYEKGSKNIKGESIYARTVLFGSSASLMKDSATDELWKLFNASVLWAIQKP
jgi:hypothetical protein